MTLTGEYAPADLKREGITYPTAFGITFTPTAIGVLAALGGLALAAYLGTQLVLPTYEKFQELQKSVAEKEQTLEQQTEVIKQINQLVENLNQAKVKNQEVRQLFSTQEALTTLMLDLNRLILEKGAKLVKFQPDHGASGVINDSSLGPELNGKLKRQVTSVSFQGTFSQTLEIMQTIDRLQTLLEVKEVSTELQTDQEQPEQPRTLISSNFKLFAYVPLSSEEIAAAAAKAAAAAEAQAKTQKK